MPPSPRAQRLGTAARSGLIAGFLAAYGWFVNQPGASFEVTFLLGALLQLVVVVLRRFVPAANQAEALFVFEMVADGVSVLLFALGVFGGIAAATADV